MYAGRIVEQAPVEALFEAPLHPYSRGLLGSIMPVEDGHAARRLAEIPGMVPALWALPAGCAFAPRCRFAVAACREQRPPLTDAGQERKVACWRADEIRGAA